MRRWSLLAVLGTVLLPLSVWAQEPQAPTPEPSPSASPAEEAPPEIRPQEFPPYILGAQANFIAQHIERFKSPYSGPNSLMAENNTEISQLYTIFVGVRVTQGLEVFVNPELATGHGLSSGFGVAGYLNGDVIRNPSLGGHPYLGRYFLRGSLATGETEEMADRQATANALGGPQPTDRLVFTFGRFGMNDLFDTNRYANSSRTQFLNWSFISNTAWDYPADTRGYTTGIVVEWEHPDWALRLGSGLMPTYANGPKLDAWPRANGSALELELRPLLSGDDAPPTTFKLLAYRNVAAMGNYDQALAVAAAQGVPPDIGSQDRAGLTKYGFCFNLEQPVADDGDTGLFVRLGWSDGRNESFAYTECDATASLGAQINGSHWGRPRDRIGVGLAQNMLLAPHRNYLAAGGLGFIVGDGALRYAPERVVETYYWWQFTPHSSLSLDLQYIQNPGYNADRGPAFVPGLRLHVEY